MKVYKVHFERSGIFKERRVGGVIVNSKELLFANSKDEKERRLDPSYEFRCHTKRR